MGYGSPLSSFGEGCTASDMSCRIVEKNVDDRGNEDVNVRESEGRRGAWNLIPLQQLLVK